MQYIAFDSHKKYTLAVVETEDREVVKEVRIPHERGELKKFLAGCERGSRVAVETIGNWYWIVDEIEEAGDIPLLVHARKAKLMMGMVNKTDKLDAHGLCLLARNGTLPEVWIPSMVLRDQRDLPRTRMVFVRMRTRLKNRLHAALGKYALGVEDATDIFAPGARADLLRAIGELPEHTRFGAHQVLLQVDTLLSQVERFEERMKKTFGETAEVRLLKTLPGIGFILAVVIVMEVGDVGRFLSAAHLASYSGTTPRVHESGGKRRYGLLRPDVNRYLKWAFVEAANTICMNRRRWPDRHVSRLYERIAHRKGHAKAIGAVARHLAEATYRVLSKKAPYSEAGYGVKRFGTRIMGEAVSSTKA